nr:MULTISPECIES: AAA family ATPase [Marinitoga]
MYDKWDFKEYPIIRLNLFKSSTESEEKFKKSLVKMIEQEGERNGIEITETDYTFAFDELIMKLSKKEKVVILIDEYITEKELLEEMKRYYNGFSFDGEHTVYNPYSILRFFSEKEFQNFWFESGSPSFLYEYIKGKKIEYEDLVKTPVSAEDFSTREIEDAKANIFFTQAGYLTFKGIKKYGLKKKYILDYPNFEVKESLLKILEEINKNNNKAREFALAFISTIWFHMA